MDKVLNFVKYVNVELLNKRARLENNTFKEKSIYFEACSGSERLYKLSNQDDLTLEYTPMIRFS